MGYVSIPPTANIAAHAALTQNVHGVGAYDIADLNDVQTIINSNVAVIEYAGNNTANRAVAHGLNVTPKMAVLILKGNPDGFRSVIDTIIAVVTNTQLLQYTVTTADSTNIYVGNATSYAGSSNETGETYVMWVLA